MIAWQTSLSNGCTHTHTLAINTERFAITFWKGKISSEGLTSTNSEEEKPQRYSSLHIDYKAQYASFKHIFI